MGAFRNTNAALITVPLAARFDPYIDPNEMAEKSVATSSAAVMVTGLDVFNISGGPIVVLELMSVCVTANNGTASTLQWGSDGTDGAAVTFTGASASLASAAAGAIVATQFTATTTAPALYTAAAGGVGISRPTSTAHGMIVPAGIIEMTIAVGSTTGTWRHYLRYRPMARGIVVTALF
jgi:hypothetical protein